MKTKTDVALERGLYRSLLDSSGQILPAAWQRAIEGRELVGLCRRCDGFMQPTETPASGRTRWYEAHCLSCYGGVAVPARHSAGGLPLHRSARHDEIPAGSFDARYRLLKQLSDLTKANPASSAEAA